MVLSSLRSCIHQPGCTTKTTPILSETSSPQSTPVTIWCKKAQDSRAGGSGPQWTSIHSDTATMCVEIRLKQKTTYL